MRITFYGGAKSVTGANYLFEAGGLRILVDCGFFQGSLYSEEYNYAAFKYDPSEIDCVLVTHSHVDHMARLPKLYKDGFRGIIYATVPTQGVIEAALPDAMDKMLQEAREMKHAPLYVEDDMRQTLGLMKGIKYAEPLKLNEHVTVIFHEAGHILGSAIIELIVHEDGRDSRILFTGDLGNPPTPLLHPIDYVGEADYAVVESAYGNRIHEDREQRRSKLVQAITDTVGRGGVLMIPSFAIERTQELLLELDDLLRQKKITRIPIFVDSPLASKITDIYGKFFGYFNQHAMDVLERYDGLFKFPWLTFTPSVGESKHINDVPPPKIIIAGSGMSTGGRILHHELRYLPDEKSAILFVGFQVRGSLGRRILDKEPEVSILGQKVPVRCRIHAIGGYSAHADQNGLLKFVEHAAQGGRLKKVFVVQGEEESATVLADKIKERLGITAIVPDADQAEEL